MSQTTPTVTIFGGSGFVGRYIAHRMARAGWRVRVAVRRPNEAMFVRTYGDVGQVEQILCNVRDEASTRAAISGADAVINCVGILQETKFQSFEDVHVDAPNLIARLTTEAGISKLVHISSLSAGANGLSSYAESKAEGDAMVLDTMPEAIILRPSIIFGTEDKFFNRIAEFSRFSPILPLICADAKFQPVYVDDVAAAAVTAVTGDIAGGIYELGGPEVATLRELAQITVDVAGRKRILINAPIWIARSKAWAFEMFEKATGGLFPAMLTRDQIDLLHSDNVVNEGSSGFAAFGITPTAMGSILGGYLYSFRNNGQYTAITDSGKNLNL